MYLRPIIVLFILLAGETSLGQEKKGLIVDPDGFTNVRDAPSGSAEIISRIVDGEVFSYSKSNKSWYPVKTYKGVEGFVHKSRIKEFKITRALRLNKNMQELLVYTEAYKVISVCGNAYEKTDDSQLYSGLIVGDGLNQTIYQEFFEGAIQSFEFKNGQIHIYEYANLPANDKLENELIPFALSRVFLIGGRIINIS